MAFKFKQLVAVAKVETVEGTSNTHNPERDAVEWGSDRIYARLHQLGGRIRAKNKPFLVSRLADGSVVKAREVHKKLPRRKE